MRKCIYGGARSEAEEEAERKTRDGERWEEAEEARSMQQPAKKRPSFTDEIHFRRKENGEKSSTLLASFPTLFPRPSSPAPTGGSLECLPSRLLTPLSGMRKGDHKPNRISLIKF
ncbi:hypothetical protein KM043_015815 [Ampulex compressa]|nr:hypothetical protein KM043_015815 [Ampulex compressa]